MPSLKETYGSSENSTVGEEIGPWKNGVTLKRTRDGYSWTIAVGASGASMEELRLAVRTAIAIDGEISDTYGEHRRGSVPKR